MSNITTGKVDMYGTSTLKEEDIQFVIKLPAIKKFSSRSKKGDDCPFGKVHRYLGKQMRNKHKVPDLRAAGYSASDILVSIKTAEEINKEVINWIPYWRSYLINGTNGFANAFGMMSLDYSFNHDDSDFIEDGKMYILKPSRKPQP